MQIMDFQPGEYLNVKVFLFVFGWIYNLLLSLETCILGQVMQL